MKTQINLVKEEVEKEPPITANGLLGEIMPLLDEYFIGEISLEDKGIFYFLPNGQKFLIKAEQVS